MKRVVVGLSGGVDSSVTAYLLKEQGYDVVGLFMKNWHDESVTLNNECAWIDDSNDAMLVAQKLGIPFQVLDLSKEYKERIVDYMFAEYESGRTPNPDVLCNREIKFDIFLKAAIRLKADFVATGHYCRKEETEKEGKTVYRLLSGADNNKDQSYFLCQLTQEQLKYALFPIGHLQKSEVREIARDQQLVTAEKKDSQGLCFVGKIKLPEFLQQKLQPKKGLIMELEAEKISPKKISSHFSAIPDDEIHDITSPFTFSKEFGTVIGEHPGAHYFTIGQRKGLQVGGREKPLFVLETDTRQNIIYTGQGEDHPGLNRPGLQIMSADVHWIREDLKMVPGERRNYKARIRYRQPLVETLLYCTDDFLYLVFDTPQKGIARGQFAAWYDGDELLGSGIIS